MIEHPIKKSGESTEGRLHFHLILNREMMVESVYCLREDEADFVDRPEGKRRTLVVVALLVLAGLLKGAGKGNGRVSLEIPLLVFKKAYEAKALGEQPEWILNLGTRVSRGSGDRTERPLLWDHFKVGAPSEARIDLVLEGPKSHLSLSVGIGRHLRFRRGSPWPQGIEDQLDLRKAFARNLEWLETQYPGSQTGPAGKGCPVSSS